MDKKFLNKVLDQIVSETRIDYDRKGVSTPLNPYPFHHIPLTLSPTFLRKITPLIFTKHCRGVYGLNEQEIDYVWKEYRNIIMDKIENNG